MSNYNTQLQSNNTDLQTVLEILQTKAAGGEQATPVISVDYNGLITATAGTKSSTHQLSFQAAKTIIPGTSSQIAVSSGCYTGGDVTVAAIPSTYVNPSYTKTATTYTPSTTNQIISAGTYLTGVQTIKGDANLVAGNIKSGVSIFGVSGTLEEGSGGGGEQAEWSENEDAMVTRTLSSYFNDRVTTIGSSAFYECSNLTSVNFPLATTIGNHAFYSCSNLTSVSFPAAANIGSEAFRHCSNLTSVNFPLATTIGNHAFSSCSNLTSVNFPAAANIGTDAFRHCSNLTSVNFPAAANIGTEAFRNCDKLTSVNFPLAITIGNFAFYECNLTSVNFPLATTIGNHAFSGCRNLTSVNFPAAANIGTEAFRNCGKLTSLYLTGSSLCQLSNSNAFSSTPICGYSASAGTYGSIYVPASLLTSYQTATNWAYFSSRFVGI